MPYIWRCVGKNSDGDQMEKYLAGSLDRDDSAKAGQQCQAWKTDNDLATVTTEYIETTSTTLKEVLFGIMGVIIVVVAIIFG